jgi:NADH-quinone oxidoreductase subunit F
VTEPILSRNFDRPEARTLDGYRAGGGYEAFRKALGLGAEGIAAEVKKANLRGLGGAGFPTATKWGFIPAKRTGPVYLVVNADEGEPGTFKDRYILERDPHALIEGMLISAYAIGCHTSFVYIRGEYVESWRIFSGAVRAAETAGLLGANILGSGFEHRIVVHRGAGAYRCGEETGSSPPSRARRGGPRSSRRSRRSRAPSASPRSSTTSRRSPRCPTSSRAAASGSPGSARRPRVGRGSTPCPATSIARASTRRRWRSRSAT